MVLLVLVLVVVVLLLVTLLQVSWECWAVVVTLVLLWHQVCGT